jgi:transposase
MDPKPASRRRHGADVKATVLAACSEPGASVAAVALSHGLNANLVRKWLAGRGLKRAGVAAPALTRAVAAPPLLQPVLPAQAKFVPVAVAPSPPQPTPAVANAAAPANTCCDLIHIELRRGPLHLNVRWPTSAAADCTAWLSELTAALSK